MHGPRGGGGGCAWVLEGGGGGVCMGPRAGGGGGVRAWVLQGWYHTHTHTHPNHTQLNHLPVHHLPAPPPARQCMGRCALHGVYCRCALHGVLLTVNTQGSKTGAASLTISGLWTGGSPPPPCLDSGPPCLVSVKLYPDMQCTRLNHTHRSPGRRLSPSPCLVRVKLYPDMQCTHHTHRSLGRTPGAAISGLWTGGSPPPPCLDSGPPCLVSVKLYPDMQCTRLNHTHRSPGRRLSPSPCLVRVKLYPDMQCTHHTHRSLGRTPGAAISGLWTGGSPPPPCLDSGPPCLVSGKLYPDMQCTRLNHTHRSPGRRLSPSPASLRTNQ